MTDPRRLAGSLVRSAVLRRTAVGVATAAGFAVGFGAVLAVIMARVIITPPTRLQQDMTVLAVDPDAGTIELTRTEDALIDGQYSLWFDGDTGHATVGDVIKVRPRSVTRRLLGVRDGVLRPGVRARFAGWFYMSPDDLNWPYENVMITSDVGECPAWLIPADASGSDASGSEASGRQGQVAAGSTTERNSGPWVIQVHGRATQRSEGLRAVPVFREAGFTSLLISYRNDGDAPKSPDGRYGLGDTEWRDVEAAIRFAKSRGATDIVLMGWSMGGATSLQTITRSADAGLVSGVVLESPVIDWVDTLKFQAKLSRVPRVVGRLAMGLIGQARARLLTGQSSPIDLARLDFVARADELNVPILLLHSDDDGYVPSGPSHALAQARPDIVTFVPFTIARHTRLWNHDPERWTSSISAWLAARLPSSGA